MPRTSSSVSPRGLLDEQAVLKIADVLTVTRVTRETLRSWIKRGIFPAPLPGTGRLWSSASVRKWLEGQQEGAAHA